MTDGPQPDPLATDRADLPDLTSGLGRWLMDVLNDYTREERMMQPTHQGPAMSLLTVPVEGYIADDGLDWVWVTRDSGLFRAGDTLWLGRSPVPYRTVEPGRYHVYRHPTDALVLVERPETVPPSDTAALALAGLTHVGPVVAWTRTP